MISFSKLKEVLDKNFVPPFIAKGLVQTRWVKTRKGRVLEIKIDRRDVWLDKNGKIVGSGTCLCAFPIQGEGKP